MKWNETKRSTKSSFFPIFTLNVFLPCFLLLSFVESLAVHSRLLLVFLEPVSISEKTLARKAYMYIIIVFQLFITFQNCRILLSLNTLSSRYFKIYHRNRSFGDYHINFGLFFLPAFHLQYLVLLISLLNRLFLVRKGYWGERARQNHIFFFFLHLLNIKFFFRFMESWHLFDNRYDSGIISSLFSALETFIPLREVLDFAIFTDPVFMNHCDHFFFLHLSLIKIRSLLISGVVWGEFNFSPSTTEFLKS